MAKDISKKAIVVLLVLVVLVSILGTWVVLDATSGLTIKPVEQETIGKLSQAPALIKEPQTSGRVSLEVIEEEEGK